MPIGMRLDQLDFPQARTAPEDVVRVLKEIDARDDLLYSRGRRWILCRYRPEERNDTRTRRNLATWRQAVQRAGRFDFHAYARLRQLALELRGWEQIASYDLAQDDFGMVINDARMAKWRRDHTSESEMFAEIDAIAYDRRAKAHAEIADIHRAKEAHSYAFKLSHRMGTSLTPEILPKAGWVRQMTLSA